MSRRGKKSNRAKRVLLSVVCIVLGIVLAGMLGVSVFVGQLLNRVNYVEPETQETISMEEFQELIQEETDPDATGETMDPTETVDTNHDTQIGGEDSGVINILLIGQDRREGETRARSDSMILCTINKETGTLTMTSFLRDLWVAIPGYGNNRINASYAAGGMSLLNQTLDKNFGIYVDGNIEVDFNRFAQIIDLLGGVEMELRQDEANVINRSCGGSLSAGIQQLNGEEALCYARIRKLDADADFSRTNRQRKLLNSLIEKFRSADLNTMMSLLNEALPMITTDMTQEEILSLAMEMFPLLSDLTVVSQRIPADNAYALKMINGMSVIQADMDAARQLLEDTLQ